jgi:hypothetical protein
MPYQFALRKTGAKQSNRIKQKKRFSNLLCCILYLKKKYNVKQFHAVAWNMSRSFGVHNIAGTISCSVSAPWKFLEQCVVSYCTGASLIYLDKKGFPLP